MKKWLMVALLLMLTAIPVGAAEIVAPEAPGDVDQLIPQDTETFVEGLWYVFTSALAQIRPDIAQCCKVCFRAIAVSMLVSLLRNFHGKSASAVELAGVVCIGCLLLRPTGALISLGVDTVRNICQYGQLLLPVMTAALAGQGGGSTSVALNLGTAFANSILSGALSTVLMPMMYIYLAISLIHAASGEELIGRLSSALKGVMTWGLKLIIYIFTGYIGITGVISGTTDQAALKAAKLTIAGAVPMVGNILSDASQTILLSAAVAKNSAGIYGIYAVLAITLVPFLKIGVQYLLLKLTSAICGVFCHKKYSALMECFTGAMGFLLAATGTACVIQLISTVCFMKGIE